MTSILLTYDPLDIKVIESLLQDDSCGGQVIFVGTVRDFSKGKRVTALDFEAYEPMALLELEKISADIKAKWPVVKIVLHHRLGKLLIGEVPVIAGVSSAHRAEAFEACAYLMDALKRTVPIWKKEIFENGEEWVSPTP